MINSQTVIISGRVNVVVHSVSTDLSNCEQRIHIAVHCL